MLPSLLGSSTRPFAQASLLSLLLCGGTAQAAGLLNEAISLQDTRFCQETQCQLAGRQPIAGSLWEFVYRTGTGASAAADAVQFAETDTVAVSVSPSNPVLRVYTAQGRVTAGSLSLSRTAAADATEESSDLLRREDYEQTGTPAYLTAEFAALMLGQKPTALLLSEWQAACESGERLNFAGARLSCSVLDLGAEHGGEVAVFHIGR